jgi:hypothetical protein
MKRLLYFTLCPFASLHSSQCHVRVNGHQREGFSRGSYLWV